MIPFCQAATLILHIGTLHFPQADNQNVNPGIGVACAVSRHVAVGTGVYRNSQVFRPTDERKWNPVSFYGAVELHAPLFWGFEGGVVGGLASGYRRGAIAPLVGLVLHSPEVQGFRFNTTLGPRTAKNSAVLHFTISKQF